MTFKEFFAEQEKKLVMFGTGMNKKQPLGLTLRRSVKPINLAKKYDGIHVPHVYSKPEITS